MHAATGAAQLRQQLRFSRCGRASAALSCGRSPSIAPCAPSCRPGQARAEGALRGCEKLAQAVDEPDQVHPVVLGVRSAAGLCCAQSVIPQRLCSSQHRIRRYLWRGFTVPQV